MEKLAISHMESQVKDFSVANVTPRHIVLRRSRARRRAEVLKRGFDLSVAVLAAFLLLPLLLVVALAIKLDTPGPILFCQSRRGLNGKPFKIFKFRTMTVLEDGDVVQQARRGDSRVTRIGRFLRSTSIDELPQLLNVIRGEMSLVGPRPHAMAHDDYYSKHIESYNLRQAVKPGITGWAQINGSRGETPELADMKRRIELDLWYVHRWSVTLDVKIVVVTAIQILRSRDAF